VFAMRRTISRRQDSCGQRKMIDEALAALGDGDVEYHGHVTALDAEQHANEGTADE
jgi:hypothetical protein